MPDAERSAGIALVRFFDGVPKLLCLRIYGSYDLPKGKIEQDEHELVAARRETSEETGIENVAFTWGMKTLQLSKGGRHPKVVTLFVAQTDDEPVIMRNPTSGVYEHHGYAWLGLDDAGVMLHQYLRPCVPWVVSVLESHLQSSS